MYAQQTSNGTRIRSPLLFCLGLFSLLGPVELAPAQSNVPAPAANPAPAPPPAPPPATSAPIATVPATTPGATANRPYDPTKLEGITVGTLIFKREKSLDIIVASGEYRILVLEALRSRGLNALGAESLAFGVDRSAEARFVLSGTILDLDCIPPAAREGHGTLPSNCSLKLRWEMLDRTRGQVVYERLSSHEHRGFENIQEQLIALMSASVNELADRVRLLTLLKRDEAKVQADGTPMIQANPCPAASKSAPPLEAAINASLTVKTSSGAGSAFLISPDGLAVTNQHVVENETEVKVILPSGLELPAQVLRRGGVYDLALIKVNGENHACIHLAEKEPKVGAPVYVVGAPLGQALSSSVSRGVVSGFRSDADQRWIQTDASVNPGNSGGSMLTEDGQVVAVVSFKLSKAGFEGLGFGIAAQHVVGALGIQWQRHFVPRDAVSSPRLAEFFAPDRIKDTGDNPSTETIASLYSDKVVELDPSAGVVPQAVPMTMEMAQARAQTGIGLATLGTGVLIMLAGASSSNSSEDRENLVRIGGLIGLVGGGISIRGAVKLSVQSSTTPPKPSLTHMSIQIGPTSIAMSGQF